MSIKERIRKAGPTTRTVPVWLGADLDLLDEYNAAVQAAEEPQEPSSDSLAAGKAARKLQERVDELRARLAEYRVEWRLRGLDDFHWGRLLAAHPPREGDADDAEMGYDREAFPRVVVRAATVSVDGDELDDEDWVTLLGDEGTLGVLTSTQLGQLFGTAFQLARRPVDIPFSDAASSKTRSSEPA